MAKQDRPGGDQGAVPAGIARQLVLEQGDRGFGGFRRLGGAPGPVRDARADPGADSGLEQAVDHDVEVSIVPASRKQVVPLFSISTAASCADNRSSAGV